MESEPIYWLFSSSAQAIATFVAFLLAAYAIILQLKEAAYTCDETLQQIHDALLTIYHRYIVILLILTGTAIISSLLMIYLNGGKYSWIGWPALAVFLLNAAVIALAIWFVVLVTDPSRYQKEAVALLKEQTKTVKSSGVQTARNNFFEAFVAMEKDIRDFITKRKLPQISLGRPRTDFSFRQMIDVLRLNGIVNDNLHERLLGINRTRNLVFHGLMQEIDGAYVNEVTELHEILKGLFKPRRRRAGT